MPFRKNKWLQILNNQKGDVLVMALGLVAVSLVGSVIMFKYSLDVQTNSKRPRLKSMMTSIEAKIRSELLKPASYTGCVTGDGIGGRTSCDLIEANITNLGRVIPGSKCKPPATSCGFEVKKISFDKELTLGTEVVTRAQFKITYTGIDVSLNDIDVVVDVPSDILQARNTLGDTLIQCPTSKPKFIGFDKKGVLICQALPANAPAGSFVGSIDFNNLNFTLVNLPSSADCGSDTQFISDVAWGKGGTSFTTWKCNPRLEPFATFGFTPKDVSSGGGLTLTPNTD